MSETTEKLLLTLDLTPFIGKCPSCMKQVEDTGMSKYYTQYVENSKKRFGKYSFPVCRSCWVHNCESCNSCSIPSCIAFSSELGNQLLYRTTMTPENKDSDHVCQQCACENPN